MSRMERQPWKSRGWVWWKDEEQEKSIWERKSRRRIDSREEEKKKETHLGSWEDDEEENKPNARCRGWRRENTSGQLRTSYIIASVTKITISFLSGWLRRCALKCVWLVIVSWAEAMGFMRVCLSELGLLCRLSRLRGISGETWWYYQLITSI